ncbi:MAG: hypothetical protein HPZ91_14100 [Lentisphaeria bacterium]|nr:hypothetical protein [Lentisphaeria bacterium]
MRIYRYWVEKYGEINMPDGGVPQTTRVYGYSNESPEAAGELATRLLNDVQQRVNGQKIEWTYDSKPIREEVLLEFSPQNIVTRNRYGAEVLNSENLVFVDIDGFRSPSLFTRLHRLFSGRKQPTPEEHALEMIRKTASRPEYASCAVRVYRTCAGFRLIVLGGGFTPGSKKTAKLMRRFGADYLYATLCTSQKCFRARLTPKPNRIRHNSFKFVWPRPEEQQEEASVWLDAYRAKSEPYAVCRYIETLNGKPDADDPVIRYHDEATRARSGGKLA